MTDDFEHLQCVALCGCFGDRYRMSIIYKILEQAFIFKCPNNISSHPAACWKVRAFPRHSWEFPRTTWCSRNPFVACYLSLWDAFWSPFTLAGSKIISPWCHQPLGATLHIATHNSPTEQMQDPPRSPKAQQTQGRHAGCDWLMFKNRMRTQYCNWMSVITAPSTLQPCPCPGGSACHCDPEPLTSGHDVGAHSTQTRIFFFKSCHDNSSPLLFLPFLRALQEEVKKLKK